MAAINNDWLDALKGEFSKPYYKKLFETVNQEYRTHRVYPPADDIFNAFHLTPLKDVKVVILGQDPYHGDGQAEGLSFSVKPGVDIPPSLVNIYQELHDDLGCTIPSHGNLVKWAEQGVLLLNTVLTVRAHQANSHRGIDRCSNPCTQYPGQADCIYSVGKTGTDEKENADQSEPFDPGSTASESTFCVSWIFRKQTVQPDK